MNSAYRGAIRLRQILAAALTLAPLAAAAQDSGLQVQAGLAYGPHPEEVGDVILPAGGKGLRPAVVVIHGGGWIMGDRSWATDYSEAIARLGIVVFNIDYRLAQAADPATRWPAQLADAQLAVRFLRAHAADWRVDPRRVGAVGDSAGGQLAVFLGELPAPVPGELDGLYPGQSPKVAAVLDEFGVMDIPGMGGGGGSSARALFGSPVLTQAQAEAASPLFTVTAQTAPVYILHGRADRVVPFGQSERLDRALREHGVTAVLIPFDGGHEYQGLSPETTGRLLMDAALWLAQQLKG